MIKTYLFLIGAIFCEVAGTMLLPVSQNFTKFVPTFSLTVFYLTAFYLLTFVVNKLPIAGAASAKPAQIVGELICAVSFSI